MHDGIRDVRDPRTLRAVAHPLRLTLLDLIERRGTLTSAEAAQATGENTGSCSFHLRQLAKYGYVEAAPGRDGRERRWRRAAIGERLAAPLDAETTRTGLEVTRILAERLAADATLWLERHDREPAEWQEGAVFDHELLYLTSEEMRALGKRLVELFAPYRERTTDITQRPPDARAIRAAALLFALADTESHGRSG
jgi:DNA-binding MarR family transcriptional regulator